MKNILHSHSLVIKRSAFARSFAVDLLYISIVVLSMILSAHIRILLPFTPVPLTAQTFVVLLGSAYLGWRRAPIALGIYLCLGICGLPVFSGAEGGLAKVMGPTGGYLLGFLCVSYFIGKFRTQPMSLGKTVIMFLSGSMIILLFGMLHLALYLDFSIKTAFLIGFVPFIPGDLIKVCIASGIYKKIPATQ
jgi:biotin transport system substrate-specific component